MKKTEDSSSFEQWLVLATFIAGVLRKILSGAQVQHHLQNKKVLERQLCEFFQFPIDIYTDTRNEWEKFYKKTMNLTVDFSTVRIPDMPQDGKKWRLLFIAQGITCNQVYNSWTFPKWKGTEDIDKLAVKNVRNSTKSYAIWVLDNSEPDPETLGKSTKEADSKSCENITSATGITLLERLVYESKHFDETGEKLDVTGLTFCSGSRDADGDVPFVDCDSDDKVYVSWFSVDYCYSDYGVRVVIS